MEYRELGRTGLTVSRLGFGGIPIQRIDAEGTKTLIHALAEAGVNYIDTARGYTVSEEYLGYALEGIRDKFILATKSMARDKAGMEKEIALSLRNLKTNYIDLYQVHNPTLENLQQIVSPGGALEALLEAKAAGTIGHIGLTAHSAAVFAQALELDWVETIMFPYNIVENQGQDLIRRCAEAGKGFIDMKPLAGGAIEDATLALRFLSADPMVDLLIPGMADLQELKQNLAAVEDASALTEAELQKMDAIRQALGTQFCRRCNYCQPCSVGINISSCFLFEGYANRYGLKDWAVGRYLSMGKTASDCIGCGQCESRCPYELPIQDMLRKVSDLFGK